MADMNFIVLSSYKSLIVAVSHIKYYCS